MAKNTHHSKLNLTKGAGQAWNVRLNDKAQKPRLSFSFRYFRQIENFGITGKDDVWMSGLLQQLALLSDKDPESLLSSYGDRKQLRLHTLDLSSGKSALSMADFSFIDKENMPDGNENPFWQIEISTANGRIIGFFSADHTVFYIVFLDPNHNAQLSNYSNYKVRRIEPCLSEIDDLMARIAKHVSLETALEQDAEDFLYGDDMSYFCMESDLIQPLREMLEEGSFVEKFQEFLLENLK